MIPLLASAGYAALGYGGAGLLGMSLFGKKKKAQYDPLAEIRDKLKALDPEVQAMVEKRKQLLKQQFGEARETGLRDIGEEYQAGRGFAPMSTMERGARGDWVDKIAKSLAEEELSTEEWGLTTRANLLKGMSGMYPPEEQEEAGFGEKLLGIGGQLVGQQIGMQGMKDIYKDIFTTQKPDLLSGTKGITYSSNYSGYPSMDEFMDYYKKNRRT